MDPVKKITEDQQQAQEEPSENKNLDVEQSIESLLQSLGPLDYKQMMLDMHNTCSLCGGELEFVHVTHFTHLEVEEESHCPSCNVRTKKEIHKLQ